MAGIEWVKGHGTHNDFVLFADPDGTLGLTADEVCFLADRRAGIGGDGVIRAVPTALLEGTPSTGTGYAASSGTGTEEPEWFMDYRNADGSIAQMCGNGVRVFTAFLIERGLVELPVGDELTIGTRSGRKRVRRTGESSFSVAMGPWRAVPGEPVVDVVGEANRFTAQGLGFDLGNPHVAIPIATQQLLDSLDLSSIPAIAPAPPDGANVEYVVVQPPSDNAATRRLAMRVHERGVGETMSCGTGACAAALAASQWELAEGRDVSQWIVEVPGGVLEVTLGPGSDEVELAGPAVLVAAGVVLQSV